MKIICGLLVTQCVFASIQEFESELILANSDLVGSDLLLTEGAITFEHSAGRFGDCLLHYLRAKWFAYHYKMPLLYQASEDFPYFSQLVLHDKEQHLEGLSSNIKILDIHYACPEPKERYNHLYKVPYFPETYWELEVQGRPWFSFQVDWKDPEFRKIVKEMIAPKNSIELIKPPANCINIALHIREGGGVDSLEVHFANPIKLPPLSYYQEAISRVLDFFDDQQIYCHVFTDALEPIELIEKIKNGCKLNKNIFFSCRTIGNRHDENVLEDFFSLFNFDILIRPGSNFSLVPELIHDYAMVCSPENCTVYNLPKGKVAIINQIDLKFNEEIFRKMMDRISAN